MRAEQHAVMYRKIVVGHDLHDGGSDALALGRLVAGAGAAKLIVAGVFPVGALPRGFEARWRDEEERVAAEIQSIADEAGAEPEAFPSSSPARGLHELAEEIDADLIVVGSSRHSKAGQILAGNVGAQLLHGSPCAVAVAPRDYRDHVPAALGAVTVGFDGSHESELALRAGVALARASGAVLRLVAVAVPPPVAYVRGGGRGSGYEELKEAIEQQVREQLTEAVGSVPDEVRAEATLLSGDPTERLVEAAGDGQLLILGSRAYGPLRRVVLGSVSSAIVRSARCPVLVQPRGTARHAG
jgi:nucleotide-binding universal stress UspA family protein